MFAKILNEGFPPGVIRGVFSGNHACWNLLSVQSSTKCEGRRRISFWFQNLQIRSPVWLYGLSKVHPDINPHVHMPNRT